MKTELDYAMARIAELEAELAESQRLHDAGGSREARLLARIAELEAKISAADRLRGAVNDAIVCRDNAPCRSPEDDHCNLVECVNEIRHALAAYTQTLTPPKAEGQDDE